MNEYSLNFVIDAKDLDVINEAQLRLTLAKCVNQGSPSNVAWIAAKPFVSNIVEWKDEYGLYASTTEIKKGATLTKLSETGVPSFDNAYYSFKKAGYFTGPHADGQIGVIGKGTYAALNEMPTEYHKALTFGLTQTALINNHKEERCPLSAHLVPSQFTMRATPFTIVYAWLAATTKSGMIITEVAGPSTMITLGSDVKKLTLKYNSEHAKFLPIGKDGQAVELPGVQLLESGIPCRAEARLEACAASPSLQ